MTAARPWYSPRTSGRRLSHQRSGTATDTTSRVDHSLQGSAESRPRYQAVAKLHDAVSRIRFASVRQAHS